MKTNKINIDEIVILPITNQAEFERTTAIIDQLIDVDLIEDEQLRKKGLDILEALTVLAIEYEKKHMPFEKLDPIEAIRQRIEMLNLSQKDVSGYFGGENRASEVLNRKRPLTLKMVKNLYHGLGISAEVLLAM
ncbi:transcriptional regulator [Emticicia sp. CRIBPO]|uniref:helix-turn-helix domain-containing protein n=1 Tax=Emticicia sp. CRIBPO TaxID=2683258 RepID=UPI001412B3D0|nr:transcriptional regulator [Emticicia sp. CRIBPO]NBA88280.1 transcriptional regulator [Emticicia sp. CRIBPO]